VPIAVRRATERDLPALLRLLAPLHPRDPELDATTASTTWAAILGQPGRAILLAELDDAVVGEAVAIGRAAGACKVQLATGAGPGAEALYVSAGFTERAQGLRHRLFP
jgi:hypothetical protein